MHPRTFIRQETGYLRNRQISLVFSKPSAPPTGSILKKFLQKRKNAPAVLAVARLIKVGD